MSKPKQTFSFHHLSKRMMFWQKQLTRPDKWHRPCVYVVRKGINVLYVGLTKDIHRRLISHKHSTPRRAFGRAIKNNPNHKDWLVDLLWIPNKQTGLILEANLIMALQPIYNQTGK